MFIYGGGGVNPRTGSLNLFHQIHACPFSSGVALSCSTLLDWSGNSVLPQNTMSAIGTSHGKNDFFIYGGQDLAMTFTDGRVWRFQVSSSTLSELILSKPIPTVLEPVFESFAPHGSIVLVDPTNSVGAPEAHSLNVTNGASIPFS
jgi:hypothetical protein